MLDAMRVVVVAAVATGSLWACSAWDLSAYSSGAPAPGGGDAGGDDAASGSSGAPARDAGDDAADGGSGYRAEVMADAPIGYWRLGESSGLDATDEVGAHRGGYQGGVTLGVPGVTDDGDTSLGLAGTNGSVQIGDVLDFDGNVPISLEAWIWVDVLDADYRRVVTKRRDDVGYSIFCHQSSGGCTVELRAADGASAFCDVTLTTGRWYHVVGTYDGATIRAYRDALEVCSRPASLVFTKVDAPLVLGAWSGGGNYLEGKLDEIAIYDRALSPQRVAAHFGRGRP